MDKRAAGSDQVQRKSGGEPLWRSSLNPPEIHPSTSAASNRTKQAAPANDPARRNGIGETRIDNLRQPKRWVETIRWVIRRSRLFKTCFDSSRTTRKIAKSLCDALKRLPSKCPPNPLPSNPASLILPVWRLQLPPCKPRAQDLARR